MRVTVNREVIDASIYNQGGLFKVLMFNYRQGR